MRAGYLFAGSFSHINAALGAALREELQRESPGAWSGSLEEVEVVRWAGTQRPWQTFWWQGRAAWFFWRLVFRQHIPPQDLMLRLPGFSRLLRRILPDRARSWEWSLQTQTLFDANPGVVPHFIYTDHTYRANWRYHPPRATWPVYPGWEALEQEAYRNARRIFVSSRFAAESLLEDYGLSPERVEVVGSGSNVRPPETIAPRGGCRILFVGVEWERKGGPQLVEAVERLRRRHPQVELDIVGCAGEHPGVRFHGRIPAEEVRAFYARADVFCLPSLAEPSASVLAEAALFALPIVATRVGGTPERVRDGETGLLVAPGDAEALAGALEVLLEDPARAREMGERGRALALEHFTWAAVAKKIRSGITRALAV